MKYFIFLFLLLTAFPALAQDAGDKVSARGAPVEISATESLVWDRTAKTYTALGDVVTKQGTSELKSARLIAHYNDGDKGSDISKLVAEENVTIFSPPYTAFGDTAVYNVKTGHAVLTGKNLRIETGRETDSQVLTAKDSIEFFTADNRLSALGGATATRGAEKLTAQKLDAFFADDANGKKSLSRMTASGDVTIATPKETVTGDAGVYDVKKQEAEITGKVVIRQGDSILEGTKATVDMATGQSRLFADDTGGGRVRGVFYPKNSTAKTE